MPCDVMLLLRVDELSSDLGRDLGMGVAAHDLKQGLLLLARDVFFVSRAPDEHGSTGINTLTAERRRGGPGATARAARVDRV